MLSRILLFSPSVRLEAGALQCTFPVLLKRSSFSSRFLGFSESVTRNRLFLCSVPLKLPDCLLSNTFSAYGFSSAIQISGVSSSVKALKPWHIRMDEEEKRKKMAEIEKMKQEKKPEGMVAKLKYYVKRYWYIAIPVHAVSCIAWFAAAFIAVKSGVDVISLLEHLHVPDYLVDKVKSTPANAGVAVIAFILYKIATPLRYATTLAGIKLTFSTLQKMGKLKMAKEVSYKMRSEYETRADRLQGRYNKYKKFGVRAIKKRPPGASEKRP